MKFFSKKIELKSLLATSKTAEEFLEKLVKKIAQASKSDVCSIYWLESDGKTLLLAATYGLNLNFERKFHLAVLESLVGQAFTQDSPVIVRQGSKELDFKAISGLGEENFDAYLALPLYKSGKKIGVIVLQRPSDIGFTVDDLVQLKRVCHQLLQFIADAGVIINIHQEEQAIEEIQSSKKTSKPSKAKKTKFSSKSGNLRLPKIFKGESPKAITAVSAFGKVFIKPVVSLETSLAEQVVDKTKKSAQLTRFKLATKTSTQQINKLQRAFEKRLSTWAKNIFVGHVFILKDEAYIGKIEQRMDIGMSAEAAISSVTLAFMRTFERSRIENIREKAQDVKDVGLRLLLNLDSRQSEYRSLKKKIYICQEILPSELLYIHFQKVSGIIVTAQASTLTSHISLIAGGLDIPLMFSHESQLMQLENGSPLLLDFSRGEICLRPPASKISQLGKQEQLRRKHLKISKKLTPLYSKDGTALRLLANINLSEELAGVEKYGLDGVGLYRSEFPFMVRKTFPSEEDQYELYSHAFQSLGKKEIAIRLLDVGGDKSLPYTTSPGPGSIDQPSQPQPIAQPGNSSLGIRAIRFLLYNQGIFLEQLRALLRAAFRGPHSKLKIILPLITSLEEVQASAKLLKKASAQLASKGEDYVKDIELGIMVETPAAIYIIEDLLKSVDFLCLGTNDMAQYLLAADRNNSMVRDFYTPFHPALLRSIHSVLIKAKAAAAEVTLCGFIAEDPLFLELLFGMGIRRFSVNPLKAEAVAKQLHQLDLRKARKLAKKVLPLSSAAAVEAMLNKALPKEFAQKTKPSEILQKETSPFFVS